MFPRSTAALWILASALFGNALLAQAAEKPLSTVLDGTIIEFYRDLPLTENRENRQRTMETEFKSGDHACRISVSTPPRSRPIIAPGSRYEAKWKGSRLSLINRATQKVDATVECQKTYRKTSFDIYPGSIAGYRPLESELRKVLPIKIVGDSIVAYPLGSEEARAISNSSETKVFDEPARSSFTERDSRRQAENPSQIYSSSAK